MDEYRALGLNSRGTAWGVAIFGLVLISPGCLGIFMGQTLLFFGPLLGLPLLTWGIIADVMLAGHAKEEARRWKNYRPKTQSLNYDEKAAIDTAIEVAAADICENCGTAIGKLETPQIWNDHVVCAACHTKLKAESCSTS